MKTLHAKNGDEWRDWLQRNHLTQQEVWLVFYRKGAGISGVNFDEAIDWALSFGWIDSAIRKIDDVKYARRFTPRRPRSAWSESNVERAEELMRQGRMSEHGAALFKQRIARPSFPPEFLGALEQDSKIWEIFQRFPPSHKREYLIWITSAKKDETRDRRIKKAVAMIAKAKLLTR